MCVFQYYAPLTCTDVSLCLCGCRCETPAVMEEDDLPEVVPRSQVDNGATGDAGTIP